MTIRVIELDIAKSVFQVRVDRDWIETASTEPPKAKVAS